ncbi:ANTAR domain-containing protein [Pseudonocardia sp. C8]|uniref:ANTAR domain-containing protein n=1 Tax=Pseudonocardia sp. C8 TaxID=2762759 RepID=UPI0016423D00|nr:ANTAR domain-containing protein [Pseudonocardia sp. C8]MBC3190943.1 ANTAR domain-containing protein [Pseudonocardia sp. C8]
MLAAREREHADHLEAALHSSREIGIAIGILMHSRQLNRDQAFEFLVHASQRLNRKVRDLAWAIAEAGEVPSDTGAQKR